eukprot:TRINITY_DN6459_c0_g1_i2.p1 TRINITY_DN6459_c0_g1~~TRINITY_DN6459_c0_g1_i2.p1  ORF type:complete len:581 (-),score=80.10 TRINITY_DN6459_c0_g1_i2:459-2054(-)
MKGRRRFVSFSEDAATHPTRQSIGDLLAQHGSAAVVRSKPIFDHRGKVLLSARGTEAMLLQSEINTQDVTISVPLTSLKDEPRDELPSKAALAISQKYASAYLQHLGVEPSASNIQSVVNEIPLSFTLIDPGLVDAASKYLDQVIVTPVASIQQVRAHRPFQQLRHVHGKRVVPRIPKLVEEARQETQPTMKFRRSRTESQPMCSFTLEVTAELLMPPKLSAEYLRPILNNFSEKFPFDQLIRRVRLDDQAKLRTLLAHNAMDACVRSLCTYMYWMYIGQHIFASVFQAKRATLSTDVQRDFIIISESLHQFPHHFAHCVWIPILLLGLRHAVNEVLQLSYPDLSRSEAGIFLLSNTDKQTLLLLDRNRLHSTMFLFKSDAPTNDFKLPPQPELEMLHQERSDKYFSATSPRMEALLPEPQTSDARIILGGYRARRLQEEKLALQSPIKVSVEQVTGPSLYNRIANIAPAGAAYVPSSMTTNWMSPSTTPASLSSLMYQHEALVSPVRTSSRNALVSPRLASPRSLASRKS